MATFGVASGALGVISLGLEVTQGLLKYYGSVKNATTDIARLCDATANLSVSLTRLQESLQRVSPGDLTVYEAQKQVLLSQGSIKHLQVALESDNFKIKPESGSGWRERVKVKGRNALYPFRESTL